MMTLNKAPPGSGSAGGNADSDEGFRPGTALQLKSSALTSSLGAMSSSSGAGAVQMKLAKTATPLAVDFRGASLSGSDNVVLGKCDDLSIDAKVRGTTGTYGATVTWQVRDSSTGENLFSTEGHNLHRQASSIPGGRFTVEARVKNSFLAGQADVVRTLQMIKSDETLPTVEIKGGLTRSALRERPFHLDGDAHVPVCHTEGLPPMDDGAEEGGDYPSPTKSPNSPSMPSMDTPPSSPSASSASVTMAWSMTFAEPGGKSTPTAVRLPAMYTNNGGRTLVLPPYMLKVGYEYAFTLAATTSSGRRASVTVAVTVPGATPVATIEGGTVRLVGSGEQLVFDASRSYDPDQSKRQSSSSSSGGLTYSWGCLVDGIGATKPCQTRSGTDQVFSSTSKVTLGYLPPYGRIKMTVTVSKKGSSSGGEAAASHSFMQVVNVAGSGSFPPRVKVGSAQMAGQRYANPSRSLRLSGAVIPGKPGQKVEYEWKCDDLDMSNRALFFTPVKNQLSLVIRPNVLKPRSYTFQLHASEVVKDGAAKGKLPSLDYWVTSTIGKTCYYRSHYLTDTHHFPRCDHIF